jgi:hypothetical protein
MVALLKRVLTAGLFVFTLGGAALAEDTRPATPPTAN